MSDKDPLDAALDVMAAAWGKQSGYCFFPSIRGDANNKAERIRSYREGKAWRWPQEKGSIREWLSEKRHDDVYWCPVLFEYPRRRGDLAMDEGCLWADLDEVDPRSLGEWEPSVAWETSPGRYQALWLVGAGADMQGASWPGNENQRLTKATGADPSGWDTTQLLRIPGWPNHKPEYRRADGSPPPVGSLTWPRWRSRRRWYLDDFTELPEIPKVEGVDSVLENVVDGIDAKRLWTETRLKLKPATRQVYTARSTAGADRSDVLWGLERDLADAGLNATEVVALVRGTVWNKYEGRQDEFRRLVIEANKAVAMREAAADDRRRERKSAADEVEVVDDDGHRPELQRLFVLIQNVKPPRWLVKDVWTQGACGFIAGQPKLHKSWCGLDLALSVSTGMPFLDHFAVVDPGPVMYVQEEDPPGEIKRRIAKMWDQKRADKVIREDDEDGTPGLAWLPATDMAEPEINAMIGGGMVLSDPSWQSWLDEELEQGAFDKRYRMVVLDPLLMMLGDVDDNKGGAITEQIFKPLKQMGRKHDVAICIVHHMRKGLSEGRGGQLMLGSVANHAWAQDSLYLSYGKRGEVEVERESKTASYMKFKIKGVTNSKRWEPQVTDVAGLWDEEEKPPDELKERRERKAKPTNPLETRILHLLDPNTLRSLGRKGSSMRREDLATHLNLSEREISPILKDLEERKILYRKFVHYRLNNQRPS